MADSQIPPEKDTDPDQGTSFDKDAYEITPLKPGRFNLGSLNDWIFSKMRPKKDSKITQKSRTRLRDMPSKKYPGSIEILLPGSTDQNLLDVEKRDPPLSLPNEEKPGFMIKIHKGISFITKYIPNKAENTDSTRSRKGQELIDGYTPPPLPSEIWTKPRSKLTSGVIRGLATGAFLIGILMIYGNIPDHPEIVLGIVLITFAECIIVGNW